MNDHWKFVLVLVLTVCGLVAMPAADAIHHTTVLPDSERLEWGKNYTCENCDWTGYSLLMPAVQDTFPLESFVNFHYCPQCGAYIGWAADWCNIHDC